MYHLWNNDPNGITSSGSQVYSLCVGFVIVFVCIGMY